jgi:hypothetical protein
VAEPEAVHEYRGVLLVLNPTYEENPVRLWLVLSVGLYFPCVVIAQDLPEQLTDIGYSSPAAALSALRAKPGVVVTEKGGWIVLQDKSENTLWTIAEPGNPAYPTAIKRYIANRTLEMKVLCEASKQICDNTVRQFQALNQNAINSAEH